MSELLHEHVEHFNAGVRSGDWDQMLAGFSEDAEMEFHGIPVGPFAGKDEIAVAYREQPPDDEMRVVEERVGEDGHIEARYAWLEEPDVAAGEIILTAKSGLIRKLVVTFDRGVVWG